MQNEDDLVSIAKTVQLIRAGAVMVLVLHFYWFCYEGFQYWNMTFGPVDDMLRGLQRTTGLFTSPVYTKGVSFGLITVSILGTKSIKQNKVNKKHIVLLTLAGLPLFWVNGRFLSIEVVQLASVLYIITTLSGFFLCITACTLLGRMINFPADDDPFNTENESFRQEEKFIGNEYSVNLPTVYYYKKKYRQGWINVTNPFRGTIVLGLPGSGKSFTVINSYIRQHIQKGFSMLLYDYKYPDLSIIAYNELLKNAHKYRVPPKYFVLNFENVRYTHRCNAIDPEFMTDISDAYESAYIIMLNLNKTWIEKAGDFFVDSPIILFAAIIWYLKIYKNGMYCTIPHSIELLNKQYSKVFNILSAYPELENYMSPFRDAMLSGAQDQLQGQIASAKIPLSRMISPQLYWVMSASDFTLNINDPAEPKIVCLANHPDRQNIYSAALGLYNSRIVRLINQKNRLKCSLILDELPTIFFRGLDNLIATARSNKVSVCLGLQDFSQLTRDYGQQEAEVIKGIVGNFFSGQVVGDTAKNLSERFGKIVQQRESISVGETTTTSVNTQLESLIPPSKINTLSPGMFVGGLADNYGDDIQQKFFHAQIVIDGEKIKEEEKRYRPIPQFARFEDENGNDKMEQVINENFLRIKREVNQIIEWEEERIKSDPKLCHLFPQPKK